MIYDLVVQKLSLIYRKQTVGVASYSIMYELNQLYNKAKKRNNLHFHSQHTLTDFRLDDTPQTI